MMKTTAAVYETDLPLPSRRQGKVRDIYDLPASADAPPGLLIVATDRVSAFDVVMPTPIPRKGVLLTEISTRWFAFVEGLGLAPVHLLSTDPADVPGITDEQREQLRGRITIGRRCQVVPIECVARGYLVGSGWKDYQRTGAVCGVKLPAGLQRGARLDEPIFTPATKAEQGEHDENITFERASDVVGAGLMTRLRDITLKTFTAAHEYALKRGLILADTKFEFGFPVDEGGRVVDETPIFIDEVLTPDSSRYWPADGWAPGAEQPSFDKQFVRDHLEGLVGRGEWDKTAPGPELPDRVVEGAISRYEEALARLFPGA